MTTTYRLGVDAGGTFTDFILADSTGRVRIFKTPSTPDDSTLAIAAGLALISEELGQDADSILNACDLITIGTTVALNALIQLKGVKTGLICTAGHEDSIEIRLGHKEDGHRYDATYPPAPNLVPRYLRRGVAGRLASDGSEKTPLDEAAIREAVSFFLKEGCEAIAVSFLWAALDPSHEQRAAAIVREMAPDVFLSVGSEIYPQIREYTRTSTCVVNAYLGPIMKRYVDRIESFFLDRGITVPVRYYQSNGGLAPGNKVSDRAVLAINSGPASAPEAGAFVAEPKGFQNYITVDMGGTSFDITLTKDGRTNIQKDFDFLRHRIGTPMIQVETLGAGGGSIASVDAYGKLTVGPQSAGAQPGPACYQRGGSFATVTDANVVLGYLNPEALLGGRLPIDAQASHDAIKANVADPLGLSVEDAAYGIFMIVNSNMTNGIRRVSVERGFDPRDFVLIGCGGAGAAHSTALANEIGIGTVLVPKLASGFCALGQLLSDVKYNHLATLPMRLDDKANYARLNEAFATLEAAGTADLAADGFTSDRMAYQRALDMRYVGQIHECTVYIDRFDISDQTVETLRAAFHDRHEELFTYAEREDLVEIVNLEVTVSGLITQPNPPVVDSGSSDPSAARMGERQAIFARGGARTPTPVYDGAKLLAGNLVNGPAIIEETTTTILVEPGWQASLDDRGCYQITRLT